MKKILLLILFPVFLFSQPIIEIGYDNNDSLKQVTIVPFLSSHYAFDTNRDRNNTFFGYGGDLYVNFSSKFRVSSRILKLNDDLNIVLKLLQITVNNINKNKLKIILKKIEKKLLKKSNYNLVIRNIPRYAVSVSTRTEVPVTYQSLRDTINQFGDIKSMYINYGVSFIKMSNNESTHALLNNMELGNNIISTEVI